jgi:hypothetical protein
MNHGEVFRSGRDLECSHKFLACNRSYADGLARL